MTLKERIYRRLNDPQKLSLPSGGALGSPEITVVGREYAEISGCRGLSEYCEEIIRVSVKDGEIAVRGGGLGLRSYGCGIVAVCGRINGILFEDGEGRKGDV